MRIYIREYIPAPDRQSDHELQRYLCDKLLAYALKTEYGLEYQSLEVAEGPHGKPYFTSCPVCFNKSHTEGLVAVALSESEVGVDCQIFRQPSDKLLSRICSEAELKKIRLADDMAQAFTSLWAIKEAQVKRTGHGITVPMKEIKTDGDVFIHLTDTHAVAVAGPEAHSAELIAVTEAQLDGE